jgi:hypothetical protein
VGGGLSRRAAGRGPARPDQADRPVVGVLARPGRPQAKTHDPAWVLVDLAVAVADRAECISRATRPPPSTFAAGQGEDFGPRFASMLLATVAAGDAAAAESEVPADQDSRHGASETTWAPVARESITFAGPRVPLMAAWAAATQPRGGVLVIHENRGLTEHIRTVGGDRAMSRISVSVRSHSMRSRLIRGAQVSHRGSGPDGVGSVSLDLTHRGSARRRTPDQLRQDSE